MPVLPAWSRPPNWQTPAVRWNSGRSLLAAAQDQGLSGLVAKRADSLYRPGETTTDWVDVTASAREPAN